jgi:hypothetical protein
VKLSLLSCKDKLSLAIIIANLLAYFPLLPALAQRADVPAFDRNGNFPSSKVQGNRGFYQQRYWLVVDKDSRGFNCRQGADSVTRFVYGDVLTAATPRNGDDAISVINGQSWLTVNYQLSYKARNLTNNPKKILQCKVLANTAFIAPINMDDFVGKKQR